MSSAKKNNNSSNPIEAIAGEVGAGINFLATKLIESAVSLIQNCVDSISSKSGASGKNSVSTNLKKGFKK